MNSLVSQDVASSTSTVTTRTLAPIRTVADSSCVEVGGVRTRCEQLIAVEAAKQAALDAYQEAKKCILRAGAPWSTLQCTHPAYYDHPSYERYMRTSSPLTSSKVLLMHARKQKNASCALVQPSQYCRRDRCTTLLSWCADHEGLMTVNAVQTCSTYVRKEYPYVVSCDSSPNKVVWPVRQSRSCRANNQTQL